ncbi:galactokinase [Arenibacter sp. GZD96]|uniref:galactokinase n=1 Tax=Aurantibrevibacter litoralis TaxID=3106030 RepID=UPI002AFE7A1F|nr:galactokinase [Arenibacter sp. GZD-96]MEA1786021.1 galactokinase [Arenibacter sp. GZD-96]
MTHFSPELVVNSPGRINIIGEHTDYNLGFVLPTAIEKSITFKFQKNGCKTKCHIYSQNFDVGFVVHLEAIKKSAVAWENYVLGVLNEIAKRSNGLAGFDCIIESKLPTGSGISSSAALECGLAYGLNELFDLGLTKMDIVTLARDAEHRFVGTQCGIMDQFASVMSKEGHVILLDCKTLEPTYIPFQIAPYTLVLLNTNVTHNLASSAYNTRRMECEKGVRLLQQYFPEIKSLREVTKAMLERGKEDMDSTVYHRCSYIVAENDRVLEAAAALHKNDIKELGRILYEAHDGMRNDYEISCPELDFLVDFSKGIPAVVGARLMGGGFGGCTINLVHQAYKDSYIAQASEAYEQQFGRTLSAFEVTPSKGTSIV